MGATAPIYDRKAFVANLDLDSSGQVDASEKRTANLVFDQIAGAGKSSFTVEDFRKFANDPARVGVVMALTPGVPDAPALLLLAAKFDYTRLTSTYDAETRDGPDHKLSTEAKTLDGMLDVVRNVGSLNEAGYASHLWATRPATIMQDLNEAVRRLTLHLSNTPAPDNAAQMLLSQCKAALASGG